MAPRSSSSSRGSSESFTRATTAPVAGLLAQALQEGSLPSNLSVLLSGRLTWPAVALLLESDTPGFDALVAPGHVATVMGPEEWAFVVERHRIPTAVAGFSPASPVCSGFAPFGSGSPIAYLISAG